ncbi:MAG TPA: hypothetical protein VMB48_10340, partial [Steroidobacteraceae bacterium]|nr:hypothetical protein [Steroidobacteraceae bacterium]
MVIWLIWQVRLPVPQDTEEFLSLWLPAMPATAAHPSAAPPSSRGLRGHSRPGAAPSVPFSLPGPLLWPAPSPPAAQQQSPPPGAGVDWVAEAGPAAAAAIEQLQQDAERLHALTRRFEPRPDPFAYHEPNTGFWSGEGASAHTVELVNGIP